MLTVREKKENLRKNQSVSFVRIIRVKTSDAGSRISFRNLVPPLNPNECMWNSEVWKNTHLLTGVD